MEIENLIGSRLVFGIPGTRVRPEDIRLFRETRAGGLILYRINFESPEQLNELIDDLEEALGRRLLVVADHEGGRVVMFRDGVTIFPDNLAIGRATDEEIVRRQGEIEGRELRRLGIDVNFAPVLDVLTDAYSPNIGIRSYGKDPQLVARLGAARIKAMQKAGLSATAKHFPGKGHSPLDAHLKLPTIRSTWKEMEAVHLVPFRAAIEAGVDVIMTSHPLYPHLEPEPNTPATFSRRIVGDYLRKEMGYQGVVSSDDLEMGAIRELCPIGQAAVRTAAAGHDLLLSCHDADSQRQVHAALMGAYRDKSLPLPELEESAARIEALKARRSERFAPGPLKPEPGGPELAREAARRGAAVLRKGFLPVDPSQAGPMSVIFPALGSLAARIMIEKAFEDETGFIQRVLSDFGVKPSVCIVAMEPSEEQIEGAARDAAQAGLTVLFCFDAHLYPSNRRLLDKVQRRARKLAVVLMRDPYDVEFVGDKAACVTGFGFRVCQLEAAVERIFPFIPSPATRERAG